MEDVTECVYNCASELNCGEWISGTNFELFNTINAVEVGDSRMDLYVNGFELKPPNFPQLNDFLFEPLLGHLFAWLDGNLFSQTLWQCLPMHHSLGDSDHEKFLLIFFGGLVPKIANFVRAVADEEEFVPLFCGPYKEWISEYEQIVSETTESAEISFTLKLIDFFENPNLDDLEILEKLLIDLECKESKNHVDFFSVDITRPYWPSGPPRHFPKLMERSEIFFRAKKIFKGFRFVFSSLDESLLSSGQLIDLMESVGSDYGDELLVRALLHFLMFTRDNFFKQIFMRSLIDMEISSCKDFPLFAKEAGVCLSQICSVLCHHPARIQRNLKKIYNRVCLLAKGAVLIDMSAREKFDKKMKIKSPLTLWSTDLLTRLVSLHLLLGFDLEIYDETEAAGIFWIVDFFTNVRLSMLDAGFSQVRSEKLGEEISRLSVEKRIWACMFRMLTVLEKLGALKVPQEILKGREKRFVSRIAVFAELSAFFKIEWNDFVTATDAVGSSALEEEMLELKKLTSLIPETQSGRKIKRALIANQIAVKQFIAGKNKLVSLTNKYDSRILTLDFK